MDIVIKRGSIKDLDIIKTLNGKLFENEIKNGYDKYKKDWSFSEEASKYFTGILDSGCVFIASIDNEPVGYIAGSICDQGAYSYYEGLTAELENMYVEEAYRSLGVGTKLTDSFTKWCQENKAKRVLVTASALNKSAISFYQKNLFREANITLALEL